MALTQEALDMERSKKGSYRGYMLYGKTVELHFASPTGDETDSVTLKLECETHEQAADIALMHQRVWGHDQAYTY